MSDTAESMITSGRERARGDLAAPCGGPGPFAPRRARLWWAVIAIACLPPLAAIQPASARSCVGDCDRDGVVDIVEIISMVRIALQGFAPDDCRAGDADGDGEISIDELVGAVLAALEGCESEAAAGSIRVAPGTVLLTGRGERRQLVAVVLDAAGQPTDEFVTWHSSDPTVVTVDDTGVVTATAEQGSAQIVARSGALASAPVLALAATPVDGAVLVADEQVVGAPVALDDDEDYDVGWRYQVVLRGVSPLQAGDMLVGTGEQPVAGRVVAAEAVGGDQLVTVEVATLDELFATLAIDETIDLSDAPMSFPDELLAEYEIRRLADGTIEFEPRPEAVAAAGAGGQTAGLPGGGTRALGRFLCQTDADFPLQLPKPPAFKISPKLSLLLRRDPEDGLQQLALAGNVKAELKGELGIISAFEGEVKCEVELAVVTIPINGALSFVAGGQIPLGFGFELKAKLVLAELGIGATVASTAEVEAGIDCSAGSCTPYATGSPPSVESQIVPLFPDPTEQFHAELRLYPFAFADLALGSRLAKGLRIVLARLGVGVVKRVDLRTPEVQVANAGYASDFRTSLLVEAIIGQKLELLRKIRRLFKVNIEPLKITIADVEIERSPRGTFTISPTSVQPGTPAELGEQATFTVTLDPITYFGLGAVESVEILRRLPGPGSDFTLVPGRPTCRTIRAASGQRTFSCRTDFLQEDVGTQTFYAFVHARLFGLPLPFPLEIATDARASVVVGAPPPTPTPRPRVLDGGVEYTSDCRAMRICQVPGGLTSVIAAANASIDLGEPNRVLAVDGRMFATRGACTFDGQATEARVLQFFLGESRVRVVQLTVTYRGANGGPLGLCSQGQASIDFTFVPGRLGSQAGLLFIDFDSREDSHTQAGRFEQLP